MFRHTQITRFGMIVIAVLALFTIFAVAQSLNFHLAPDLIATVSWNG